MHPHAHAPVSRRACLGLAATPALGLLLGAAGCAHGPAAPDRLTEGPAGPPLTRDELVARARRADFVLLGELHDNPHHHQRRGALLAELRPAAVVAEQLEAGAQVLPGPALLPRLQAAGFDPRGWGWPLHQPLFEPVLAAELPLWGGNAPLAQVRAVARGGEGAWPEGLRDLLMRAPLAPAAQAALDAALVAGHCGQLPAARVPPMRAAQRLRDAAMAQALLRLAATAGGRPVALVAGNGHVRDDHGVPALLRALAPQARIVSVVFTEGPGTVDAPASVHWATSAARRSDPCAGFRMPAASAPQR